MEFHVIELPKLPEELNRKEHGQPIPLTRKAVFLYQFRYRYSSVSLHLRYPACHLHELFDTDKMEFHVIELPKLPEELKENSSDIELWAKFINAERKEELEMIATKNSYIASAYEQFFWFYL